MKSSDTLRLAVIGVGFIGNYHARAILDTPGVELALAADVNESSLETFASVHDVPEITANPESIARRKDIDAVVIGVPNKFHAPYAIKMLKAGKHVMVEKPMAMNLKEAQAMCKAAQQSGKQLAVGHMWRFDLEVNYLKAVVQSGLLGRIVRTTGYGVHSNWGPAGWFTQKKLAGGGALVDMGVHAIDTVRYMLGDPLPKSVFARLGTYYGKWDVDDTGVLMINWSGGSFSVIESGWWQPHMDGPEAATQLYGTQGHGRLFPTELKFKIQGYPGKFVPPLPTRAEHCGQCLYDRQMSSFIASIRKDKAPIPGAREGLVIMSILDAAYKSAATGKAVEIGLRPEA